ncbi:hypothetical protein GCM10009646_68070 [Streptomyces aureus]
MIRVSAKGQQLAEGNQEQPSEQKGVATEKAGLPGNARQEAKEEEALQNDGSAREQDTETVKSGPGDVAARRGQDPPCPERDDSQCDRHQPQERARSYYPCHGVTPPRPQEARNASNARPEDAHIVAGPGGA